jgi:hypothetical protein
MKKTFLKIFFGLVMLTIIFLTIYVANQQVLRIDGNSPQIQMAEDTANALMNGASPADFMPSSRQPFDMSQSLATFTMIFDGGGVALESSATLAGESVVPPAGTFDYAKTHGEDRFTWQPKVGERFAVVLKYYGGSRPGFVLVGRSLREVEKQEDNLLKIIGLAWLGSIFILFLSLIFNLKFQNAK